MENLAYRSYQGMAKKTGLPLEKLGEKSRVAFAQLTMDIQSQPRRFINTSDVVWVNRKRTNVFTIYLQRRGDGALANVDRAGSHLYLDHPVYIDFGEHVPTYKPKAACRPNMQICNL